MSSLFFEKIGLAMKVATWAACAAIKAIPSILYYSFFQLPWNALCFATLHTWDGAYFVGNLLLSQRTKGSVVKRGKAGYGGVWPPYVAPGIADSRSPCPYLSKLFKLP